MDIYQRVPQRRLVDSVKPMCTYDKVLNQRVDWVEWADIQIYGARDAIYDACATSSVPRPSPKPISERRMRTGPFPRLRMRTWKEGGEKRSG